MLKVYRLRKSVNDPGEEREAEMRLREFLEDYLNNKQLIRVRNLDVQNEVLFEGKACDCPYWITDFDLSHGNDGWLVDTDGYLLIECKC